MRRIILIGVLLFVVGSVVGQPASLQPGTPTLLLEAGTSFYVQPRWSPDGAWIAVTSERYQGIWLVRPDGTGLRQLTDAPAAGFGFQWSSDGSAILARVARMDGVRRYNTVKVFDVATAEARALTPEQTLMPSLPGWSLGDTHVYLYRQGKMEVLDVNPESVETGKRQATGRVFFVQDDRLATADLETGVLRRVEGVEEAGVLNLVMAPDRSKVAFEALGGHLHVMHADGTELVDLGVGNRPQWSPDGQWVVFMRTEDDGYQVTSSELYAARVDGSETVQLTRTPGQLEMNPSWSSDGSAIVFDAQGAIYRLPVSVSN